MSLLGVSFLYVPSMIGGSFTMGRAINDEETFAYLLQKKLNRYQIKNSIKINLHIVGNIEKDLYDQLMKIILNYKLESQIIFYGILKGLELDKLYDISNIGIGSIGLEKIKSKYRSELKAREYCAVGLPFIASSIDRDFPSSIKFRFIVKSEQKINFEEVIEWYNQLPHNIPVTMHKYALNNLDYNIKVKEIINRLNEC